MLNACQLFVVYNLRNNYDEHKIRNKLISRKVIEKASKVQDGKIDLRLMLFYKEHCPVSWMIEMIFLRECSQVAENIAGRKLIVSDL